MSDFPEHDDLHIGTRLRLAENSAEERQRARLTVARAAVGLQERAMLLEMLGLVPAGKVLTVMVP